MTWRKQVSMGYTFVKRKLGRFVGENLGCPVSFNEYFNRNVGKDKLQKYDSKTMKKIED
jgi:hypothetical protein